MQILKAVTVIMVTAITFFWSNMANPAIIRSDLFSKNKKQRWLIVIGLKNDED
jgi:hypothetical protein